MTYRFDMESWVKDFAETATANKRVWMPGQRTDAGETMVLSRELEQLLTETFDIKKAPLKVFSFVPTKSKAAAGAQTLTYKQFEHFGQAKRVERFSDDLPLVNAQATSDTRILHSWGAAFEISYQDLRGAAMAGIPLESHFAMAARRSIEEGMSTWALYGDAAAAAGTVVNAYGFLNLDATGAAYVTPVTPINGSWASATPEQIIADIAYLWASIQDTTEDSHRPDTLLIPAGSWGYVSQARTYTDLSPKDWCMRNLDGLVRMESWGELDLADSAGTGPRAVAFDSKGEGWLEMPMDITFHAPQERNLAYTVPVEARFGGYINPYPLDVAYMDGI